jgi:predicted HTH domain antitoxin
MGVQGFAAGKTLQAAWRRIPEFLEKAHIEASTTHMTFQTIPIELPSDVLRMLNASESELKQRIVQAFAIQLYLQQQVTIGKAAQIAGMTRMEFDAMLAARKIPVSLLELEDVLEDAAQLNLR